MPRRAPLPKAALFALLALALLGPPSLGCASVDPAPFEELATSLQSLRDGSAAALEVTQTESREAFVGRVVAETGRGDPSTLEGALLLDPEPPFGWSYAAGEAPLYVEARRFRAGVAAVNDALVRYAGLLAELAAPELVDADRFEAMARRLDADLGAGARQLGLEGEEAERGVALFSVAATAAARAYLEGRRRDELLAVLDETQPAIDALAGRLARAMELAGRSATASYQRRSAALAGRIPGASEASRRRAIEALVDLNDRYTTRLETLRRLAHAYASLPTAHDELRRAVEESRGALPAVRELFEAGRELQALYRELAEPAPG